MGLQSETFTRKKELAQDLYLNKIESQYFGGKLQVSGTKKSWICKRVELNAMSAGQLVGYIDQGISQAIAANQLDKKVIPPEPVLNNKAENLFNDDLEARVDDFIREQLKVEDLKVELLKVYNGDAGVFDERKFNAGVTEYLAANELHTWVNSLQVVVDQKLDDIDADVESKITVLVMAAIKAA